MVLCTSSVLLQPTFFQVSAMHPRVPSQATPEPLALHHSSQGCSRQTHSDHTTPTRGRDCAMLAQPLAG